MKIKHSYLSGGGDWYNLPYSVWGSRSFNLTLTTHENGRYLNMSASSVELLMLMLVDQHLYGNYQKGDDWVY